MDVDGDSFWRSLQKALKATDADSRRELQEAEEDLRQIEAERNAADESDPPEELQQEQIDRWVKNAIMATSPAQPGAVASDNSEADDSEADFEATVPATPSRGRPWHTWLAAAAAFLVTPKFLVAATVVAGIAVTSALLQRTTTTLPFEQAIQLLMDAEQPEAIRDAAGGRVYFDVAESVMTINALANGSGTMANAASSAIQQLQQQFQQPAAFAPTSFTQSLPDVAEQLFAGQASVEQNQQWLDELVLQVSYGIQAMQAIAARPEPPTLSTNNQLHLQQIQRLLGN